MLRRQAAQAAQQSPAARHNPSYRLQDGGNYYLVLIRLQARRQRRTTAIRPASLPVRAFSTHQNSLAGRTAAASASRKLSSHNSLDSFLRHARRTALDRASTVYVGTLYEYQCQLALARFGISVERTGGAGDAGIDLSGNWKLPGLLSGSESGSRSESENPSTPPSAPVIVQCKALNRKTGPAQVRELEGALASKSNNTIGILCSTKSATKAVREALRGSSRPLVWMQIEQLSKAEDETGAEESDAASSGEMQSSASLPSVRVRQMLWNEAVESNGARGLDVGLLRDSSAKDEQIVLLWKGQPWIGSSES